MFLLERQTFNFFEHVHSKFKKKRKLQYNGSTLTATEYYFLPRIIEKAIASAVNKINEIISVLQSLMTYTKRFTKWVYARRNF